MSIDITSAHITKATRCRHALPALLLVGAGAAIGSPSVATESGTYIVATQVITLSTSEADETSGLQAIGGTRLRAIGGTRLRADSSGELEAIGGTFLRAIGGTRLRDADSEAEQLAIGGTRLRSEIESEAQAIGGTRLRAIGGTRLRSDDSNELFAIGGTRLRAIGGTRLRSESSEGELHAIGGTRLRAIGGTRLRSDDVHSVQAIGGTRLRASETNSSLEAIGGTRLRAIGGTRLRAIGGTRLRAIGGTRLRTTDTLDSGGPSFAANNDGSSPLGTSVALLLDPGQTVGFFAYGPITAISQDQLQISILGQDIALSSELSADLAQIGQVALVAGSSGSSDGILVMSDEWHVAGATNVSLLARVTSTDATTATFTLEGGVIVDYSQLLADDVGFEVSTGSQVMVSGVAY